MNQYDFKEFRILRCPHRGKYDNLTLTIELSKEDAPLELELYLRKCWQDGVMLKAEIDEMESEESDLKVPDPISEDILAAKILQAGFETTYTTEKKSSSIYQEFKWFCERNGKDYEKERDNAARSLVPLGILRAINHMKEIEDYCPADVIQEFLINRMAEIKEELGFYSETN